MSTLFTTPTRNRPQITGAILAEVKRIEAEYGQKVCAIAFNRTTGEVDDYPFTWETAQTMAGYENVCVVAIASDGHMTKDNIQRLCDDMIDANDDCFGRDDDMVFN